MLLALLGFPGVLPAESLSLISDGKSDYSIVAHRDPHNPEADRLAANAARLLQETLAKSTGVRLPIVQATPAGKPAIHLGSSDAVRKAGIPLEQIKGWTSLRQVKGKDLYLVGYDGPGDISGEDAGAFVYQGTLKAVSSFLQDLGVRFLLPGPMGTHVPKLEKVEVDSALNVLETPKFHYVIGRRTGDPVYEVANNYLRSPLFKSFGGHSYYTAVPAEKYGKSHPEYFILKNGVRVPAGNHLCISNPEVRELMLKEMEKWFDAGYEWVELAETDGYTPCECEACAAIHPDFRERTWLFHRQLAEEMQKRRPGKKVVIISYGNATREPPTSFSDFPDNVIIQLSAYSPEAMDQWKRFGVETTAYVYNWGTYQVPGFGPKRTPKYAADQIRRFDEDKVRGIYLCGSFEDMGLEGPVFYVYGQALGNPDLNERNTANDFYTAAYGAAAAPMTAFFETLYERLEAYCGGHRPNVRNEASRDINRVAFRTPEEFYCTLFTPSILIDMEKNLSSAKSMAADPEVLARIRLVEREFQYVRNVAGMFTHYRSYRLQPNFRTFEPVARAVEQRNALIDSWYDEAGKMRKIDGWPTFFGNPSKAELLAGGRLAAPLGSPATWNIEQFRKANFLPGAVQPGHGAVDKIKVVKWNPAPAGGIPSADNWKPLKQEEFVSVVFGELKNGGRFRVAYDEEAIHFDFECDLEDAAGLKPVSRGRDGKAWQSECLEIFLDPSGKRRTYFHFVFNPAQESFYDARYGFVTDDLNPLFNKEDPSWNPEWNYSTAIHDKRWTARVRIPFSALETKPPAAGSAWLAKFARSEYPSAKGNPPIQSCWPPSLDSKGFGDPSTFGELLFE